MVPLTDAVATALRPTVWVFATLTFVVILLDAFNTAVSDAYDKRMPHLIAEHAYRVAQSFSKFYAACPVLAPGHEATRGSRLALSAAALLQLETALTLLGIQTPERM